MLPLPTVYKPSFFGDEVVLRSVDWLENFPWKENSVTKDKDMYEIRLNLKDFAPEEISVKTNDGYVVVEAKHEEKKEEYGFVSRRITRRYLLPQECRPDNVKSKWSDGVLTITAPIQHVLKKDKVIPVTHESTKGKCKL